MSKEILEAVDGLGKKIDTNKGDMDKVITEQKAFVTEKHAAVEKLMDEYKTKLENEVKTLNEEMGKRGATLEEIRNEVKALKAKAGRFAGSDDNREKTAKVVIAEAFEEHFNEIKAVRKGSGATMEIKAAGTMTASANLTGNVIATYDNTVAVRGRRKITFRDLVPVINSSTGVWKFYRSKTPMGEGSLAFQTTHGATKAQVDYDLEEVTVTADYLAAFVRFAKQMAQDLPFLQNFIANELVEDYKRAETDAFLPSLSGAATAVAVTSGANTAEKIIDNIAVLLASDWDPSAIVTTAALWASVLKTKPNDYSIPGGVQIGLDGSIRFIGIPLLTSNNMATGKTLIGDFSKAAIIQREGLSVNFYEQDSDNVQRNLITAKVEARVALAIPRPDAFVYF